MDKRVCLRKSRGERCKSSQHFFLENWVQYIISLIYGPSISYNFTRRNNRRDIPYNLTWQDNGPNMPLHFYSLLHLAEQQRAVTDRRLWLALDHRGTYEGRRHISYYHIGKLICYNEYCMFGLLFASQQSLLKTCHLSWHITCYNILFIIMIIQRIVGVVALLKNAY